MTTKEKIESLERALDNMKSLHLKMAKEYGSELCAGDMLKQEAKLQEEIDELKAEYKSNAN